LMIVEKVICEAKEALANPTLVVIGEAEGREVVAQSGSQNMLEQENVDDAVCLNFSIGQRETGCADKFEDVFALKGGKVGVLLQVGLESSLAI
jgi:hypothetical protein